MNIEQAQLRADILRMAIGITSENRQIASTNQTHVDPQQRQPIEHYTPEEVLSTAEKLIAFISKK